MLYLLDGRCATAQTVPPTCVTASSSARAARTGWVILAALPTLRSPQPKYRRITTPRARGVTGPIATRGPLTRRAATITRAQRTARGRIAIPYRTYGPPRRAVI